MRSSMSSRIGRPAAAISVAFLLTSGPVAIAVPADQGAVLHRATTVTVPHLTPSQLRAIDGHQPIDPPVVSAQPPAATPLKAPDSGSSVPDAALLVLAAAGLAIFAAAAFRLATHRSLIPRRSPHVSV